MTFLGKIGDLRKRAGDNQLYMRIDNIINRGDINYLFVYETGIEAGSDLYEIIYDRFEKGDLIHFIFSIDDGMSPKKRKEKINQLVNRNSGSFPFNTLVQGELVRNNNHFTNDMINTLPDGNYFFPNRN